MKPASSKYWRTGIRDGKSVCPVCGVTNTHLTGNDCGHVAKITAKGVVWYYWGYRPLTPEQEKQYGSMTV